MQYIDGKGPTRWQILKGLVKLRRKHFHRAKRQINGDAFVCECGASISGLEIHRLHGGKLPDDWVAND